MKKIFKILGKGEDLCGGWKKDMASMENVKMVIHLLMFYTPTQIFSLCTYPSLFLRSYFNYISLSFCPPNPLIYPSLPSFKFMPSSIESIIIGCISVFAWVTHIFSNVICWVQKMQLHFCEPSSLFQSLAEFPPHCLKRTLHFLWQDSSSSPKGSLSHKMCISIDWTIGVELYNAKSDWD